MRLKIAYKFCTTVSRCNILFTYRSSPFDATVTALTQSRHHGGPVLAAPVAVRGQRHRWRLQFLGCVLLVCNSEAATKLLVERKCYNRERNCTRLLFWLVTHLQPAIELGLSVALPAFPRLDFCDRPPSTAHGGRRQLRLGGWCTTFQRPYSELERRAELGRPGSL